MPAGLAAYFLSARRDRFAAAVCLWWAGENLVDVAVYMADARDLALPLVGGGEHDWNTLFYDFGLLGQDHVAAIAGGTRTLGFLVMWGALAGLAIQKAREAVSRRGPASGAGAGAGEAESDRSDESQGGKPAGMTQRPARGFRAIEDPGIPRERNVDIVALLRVEPGCVGHLDIDTRTAAGTGPYGKS